MFTWYNFTDYRDQPTDIPGFTPVLCPCPTVAQATPENVRIWAERAKAMGGVIIYDLETPDWRVSDDVDDGDAESRLDEMANLAYMTRQQGVEVGFYGLPVRRNWPAIRCWSLQSPTATPHQILEALPEWRWAERNQVIIDQIRQYVDFICPSLYTFYDDEGQTWLAYAREHIRQAKLFSYQVRVVPFIWPGFHPSVEWRDRPMPMKLWKLQVATMRLFCDGAVVYGGRRWRTANENDQLPWNDEAQAYFAVCQAA